MVSKKQYLISSAAPVGPFGPRRIVPGWKVAIAHRRRWLRTVTTAHFLPIAVRHWCRAASIQILLQEIPAMFSGNLV